MGVALKKNPKKPRRANQNIHLSNSYFAHLKSISLFHFHRENCHRALIKSNYHDLTD